jgi:hypothetical protein
VTDYVDGKAAWLAQGLPAEGRVADRDRVGAFAEPDPGVATTSDGVLLIPDGAPPTVRPNEVARELLRRNRTFHVTTARGRYLGTVKPPATASAAP